MNHTLTIAKRELSSLFFSPVAYLVLAIFTSVTSMLFFTRFAPGEQATLRWELTMLVWLLVFIAPAISMRLLSEEFKSGTIELLMTSPISDMQLVIGKWLGAMVFFLVLLLPIVSHIIVLEINASPDYGPIMTGLAGVVLVGGLYLAIGTFVSAMNDSQLIAFIITVMITGFLTIGLYMLNTVDWVPGWLKQVCFYINVDTQYSAFAKGLIDIRNFVYFISGIALFLFYAVKLLESRRWR